MSGEPLIVGYGNPLRSDDGLGWHAVEFLKKDARLAGAELRARHQLTPELAEDFSRARLVVLIDASLEHVPGSVRARRLEGGSDRSGVFSHHFDPGALCGLTEELYGSSPPVFVISVGAASLEDGEDLSPAVAAALPAVSDAVLEIVRLSNLRE